MTAASAAWAKEPARPPVACVGETMAALVPDPVAPLEGAARLGVRIAGAESNVAVYLADHGVPARWVSALGDDPFGRRILGEVAAAGVDVTGVRTDPHRPTGLLVKDPGTESTRVHYYRRGSAASALTADVLDEDAVRTAGLVHLSGITPALSADCHDLVAALLGSPPRNGPARSASTSTTGPPCGRTARRPGCCSASPGRRTSPSSVWTRRRPCGAPG